MKVIRTLGLTGLSCALTSSAFALTISSFFAFHPVTDRDGNFLPEGSFVELGVSGDSGEFVSLDSISGTNAFNTLTQELVLAGNTSEWSLNAFRVDSNGLGIAGELLRVRIYNGPDNTGNDFLDLSSSLWVIPASDGGRLSLEVLFFFDTDLTTNVGLGDGPDALLPETIVFRGTFDRFRFDGVQAGGTFEGSDNVSAFSTDVPEPGSVAALLGMLAGGVVLALRRRSKTLTGA